MERIEAEGYNLNISRYISTANAEAEIDFDTNKEQLTKIEQQIRVATAQHNGFLKELDQVPLPGGEEL